MTPADSLWQPCFADTLVTHRFPEGVAVFNAQDKSTSYLPDPAGKVFDILLRDPQALAVADILQRLTTTARLDEARAFLSLEELLVVLAALEQKHLVSARE